METLRADGERAAAGGADQEEPGGEAEKEVTKCCPGILYIALTVVYVLILPSA